VVSPHCVEEKRSIMSIYTVCQTSVVSVTPDTTLKFIATLMKDKNLGCVVIAKDQKPVGIVTDRDLAIRGEASAARTGM